MTGQGGPPPRAPGRHSTARAMPTRSLLRSLALLASLLASFAFVVAAPFSEAAPTNRAPGPTPAARLMRAVIAARAGGATARERPPLPFGNVVQFTSSTDSSGAADGTGDSTFGTPPPPPTSSITGTDSTTGDEAEPSSSDAEQSVSEREPSSSDGELIGARVAGLQRRQRRRPARDRSESPGGLEADRYAARRRRQRDVRDQGNTRARAGARRAGAARTRTTRLRRMLQPVEAGTAPTPDGGEGNSSDGQGGRARVRELSPAAAPAASAGVLAAAQPRGVVRAQCVRMLARHTAVLLAGDGVLAP